MAEERYVDKVMSVFSVTAGKDLGLAESVSAQVMFVYDRKANIKEFNLIDEEMPEDVNRKITAWLEKNMDVQDVLYAMNSKGMDL